MHFLPDFEYNFYDLKITGKKNDFNRELRNDGLFYGQKC